MSLRFGEQDYDNTRIGLAIAGQVLGYGVSFVILAVVCLPGRIRSRVRVAAQSPLARVVNECVSQTNVGYRISCDLVSGDRINVRRSGQNQMEVTFGTAVFAWLSQADIRAILYHEIAHVHLGHTGLRAARRQLREALLALNHALVNFRQLLPWPFNSTTLGWTMIPLEVAFGLMRFGFRLLASLLFSLWKVDLESEELEADRCAAKWVGSRSLGIALCRYYRGLLARQADPLGAESILGRSWIHAEPIRLPTPTPPQESEQVDVLDAGDFHRLRRRLEVLGISTSADSCPHEEEIITSAVDLVDESLPLSDNLVLERADNKVTAKICSIPRIHFLVVFTFWLILAALAGHSPGFSRANSLEEIRSLPISWWQATIAGAVIFAAGRFVGSKLVQQKDLGEFAFDKNAGVRYRRPGSWIRSIVDSLRGKKSTWEKLTTEQATPLFSGDEAKFLLPPNAALSVPLSSDNRDLLTRLHLDWAGPEFTLPSPDKRSLAMTQLAKGGSIDGSVAANRPHNLDDFIDSITHNPFLQSVALIKEFELLHIVFRRPLVGWYVRIRSVEGKLNLDHFDLDDRRPAELWRKAGRQFGRMLGILLGFKLGMGWYSASFIGPGTARFENLLHLAFFGFVILVVFSLAISVSWWICGVLLSRLFYWLSAPLLRTHQNITSQSNWEASEQALNAVLTTLEAGSRSSTSESGQVQSIEKLVTATGEPLIPAIQAPIAAEYGPANPSLQSDIPQGTAPGVTAGSTAANERQDVACSTEQALTSLHPLLLFCAWLFRALNWLFIYAAPLSFFRMIVEGKATPSSFVSVGFIVGLGLANRAAHKSTSKRIRTSMAMVYVVAACAGVCAVVASHDTDVLGLGLGLTAISIICGGVLLFSPPAPSSGSDSIST